MAVTPRPETEPIPSAALSRLAALVMSAALMAGVAYGQEGAGWREDIGTFRLGLLDSHGLGRDAEGRAAVRAAFERALAVPVDVFVARDYPALVRAQVSGHVHYAVYSATAYATAWRLCACVEPLAAPLAADGSAGIRAVLLFRRPAPASPEAIADHRIATGPKDSIAGRRMPLEAFAPGGLPLSGAEDFLVAASSASEAEAMFIRGEVDGMFGWTHGGGPDEPAPETGTLARLKAAGMNIDDIAMPWTSDTLRFGPHAVRRDLAEEAKRTLTSFLLEMKAQDRDLYDMLEKRRAGGFSRARHDDYAAAIDMLEPPRASDGAR